MGELEDGFNSGDPALLARHLDDGAFSVNVFGATVSGRDALVAAHTEGLSRLFGDQRATYRIVETTLAGQDAALVRLRIGPDSGLATLALWVLVRRAGQWRVVAMQGTLSSDRGCMTENNSGRDPWAEGTAAGGQDPT